MLNHIILFICTHFVISTAVQVEIEQSVSIDIPPSDVSTVHHVQVGGGGAIAFRPNRINANIGDKVVFEFLGLNHTLTQSTIGQPCTPVHQLNSGFGYFNPTNRTGLTLSITVNSADSQWFFCQQNNTAHCHAGMVFALNPGDYMEEFLANVRSKSALITTHTTSVGSQRLPSSVQCLTGTPFYPGIAGITPFYPGTASSTGRVGTTWQPTATEPPFFSSIPFTSDATQTIYSHFILTILLFLFA
ncbi:hypothetical protein I7I53_07011 [Histoplasma capsulatum var. duboisii H88]|uniref:Extracellular serine-rich protein n=1 Tax=Ajellomyces capsulatus (strain H88) TaxID=544711 RepID=A0A8A1LG87_AJEC8|nr:hypothetical protein I7I53_07011 [Histoplasma capsulatum var. duboisii H88]